MRHPRTLVALTLTGLLLAAGCSDDPAEAEPEPILPSSSSADPSGEPSASEEPDEAPTLPTAATKRTYDGAADFVRHWVDLFNHAQLTGDTAPMEAASASKCNSCSGAADVVDEVYDNGGSVDSEGWKVRQVGSDGITPLDGPTLSASIRQTREVITYAETDEVERSEPSTFNVLFLLDWTGSNWRMREVEVLN